GNSNTANNNNDPVDNILEEEDLESVYQITSSQVLPSRSTDKPCRGTSSRDLTIDDLTLPSSDLPVEGSGQSKGKRKQTHNDMKDEVESKKKKGFTSFTENGRRSLQGRFSSLGTKWVLESGTIVEDALYEAGEKLLVYHPIHSFMIDLQDTYTQKLFSIQDWDEIKNDIPRTTPYADSTKAYLDTFTNVKTTERLRAMLKTHPDDVEMELDYICLSKW
ncbi:hypothetical protein BGZ46_004078, partial [Entomortierella lignicola]